MLPPQCVVEDLLALLVVRLELLVNLLESGELLLGDTLEAVTAAPWMPRSSDPIRHPLHLLVAGRAVPLGSPDRHVISSRVRVRYPSAASRPSAAGARSCGSRRALE